MSIGLGIFLAAVGAILKFAVADAIEGVDLGMIGLILMIAGAIIALFGIIMSMSGRNARSTTVVQDSSGAQRTVETDQQLPPRDVV